MMAVEGGMMMTRRVIAAVDDMLFASKIRATAEHLNVDVRFARSVDSLLNAVREGETALIVVDLHSQKIDPIALAKLIKADEKLHAIPLLGFFSHVHAELHREAMHAGYDTVIPRSVFSRDLGKILAGSEGDESERSQDAAV